MESDGSEFESCLVMYCGIWGLCFLALQKWGERPPRGWEVRVKWVSTAAASIGMAHRPRSIKPLVLTVSTVSAGFTGRGKRGGTGLADLLSQLLQTSKPTKRSR